MVAYLLKVNKDSFRVHENDENLFDSEMSHVSAIDTFTYLVNYT